jgi:hypothetical protein
VKGSTLSTLRGNMAKATLDDFEAVRSVVESLKGFASPDQERILRWAREKLGLASAAPAKGAEASVSFEPEADPAAPSSSTSERSSDIKSFIDLKKPQSDIQFAATVAYFYRFEAPQAQRKVAITSTDLQEACRQSGRSRFQVPAVTLGNAHKQGYLDKGSERGSYVVNTVGENLVAMALPQAASSGSAKSAPRRKARKKYGGAVRKQLKGVARKRKKAR